MKVKQWPDCSNVGFGTYEGCIAVITPSGKLVDIDACLVSEVVTLWQEGVTTIESCCGHNKARSYIAVTRGSVDKMLDMGYVSDPSFPVSLGIFLSKTSKHGIDE